MTILFIVNGTQALYSHRLELITRLLKEGNQVYIVSPKGKELDPLINLGCNYYEVPIKTRGKNPLSDMLLCYRYVKAIKKIKPNLVFTFYTKSNIWGGIASRLCNAKYVSNITGLGTAVESSGVLRFLTVTLYKIALKKALRIFFQNDANLKFMISQGVSPEIAYRIPGSGVSLERFPILPYPDDTNSVEFLFVSRIMKEKGIDEYIDAAKIIRDRYPYTRFHVVGNFDGNYDRDFDELQKNGVIIYHGQQFNILPYIRKTHCTILPSYYPEGMSNVLLESASCARPIITTNRPGCGETTEDHKTGYIVNQQDTEDLVRVIEEFLSTSNENRKVMGLNGRAKMEREFNREIVVDAYMKTLDLIKKV